MPWKLKLDDQGHVVVQDGKPVYIADDGKDVAYDVDHSNATVARLNNESRAFRERAEKAENSLKVFEGIEDPEKAREALNTVANLDSGQLVTAGKVQEIKDAAKKAAEDQVREAAKASDTKIKEVTADNDKLRTELHNEKVGGSFGRSKYITEKCAIPTSFVQARYGSQFKVEDGQVVGYDTSNNKIYSRAKAGDLAPFEEALEIMIEADPDKEHILKGAGNTGAGSEHGNGGQPSRSTKGNMGGTHAERVEAVKSRWPELAKNK